MPERQLFLDQLLAFAEIDGMSLPSELQLKLLMPSADISTSGPGLYPPSSPAALRRLLAAIQSSNVNRLKKDCFCYYLLLDVDHSTPPTSGAKDDIELDGESSSDGKQGRKAEHFARRRCMPKTWRTFMRGYWNLDHGLYEVSYLRHCGQKTAVIVHEAHALTCRMVSQRFAIQLLLQ